MLNKKNCLVFLFLLFFGGVTSLSAASERVWDAKGYNENSKWQKFSACDLVQRFPLEGTEKVLDIACADGKTSAFIASRVPRGRVVALDVSDSMLGFAQDAFPSELYPNLTFKHQDATQLPFQEEFDVVMSFTAMHLIPDQKSVLQGMKRALRPGGRILMQFPVSSGFLSALEDVMQEEQWQPHFEGFSDGWTFHTIEGYTTLLEEVGLHPTRVEITTLDETYPSVHAFARSIRYWLPHLGVLPEEKKQSFLYELVERYIELMPLDTSGLLHYKVDRLEVEAQR